MSQRPELGDRGGIVGDAGVSGVVQGVGVPGVVNVDGVGGSGLGRLVVRAVTVPVAVFVAVGGAFFFTTGGV